jgi:glycerophosphoryl diester phosphodiesterase
MTERRLRRVGHKGADLIAPGNTCASFDAALAAGVDMIEFDVLPERPSGGASGSATSSRGGGGGRLVLAHDYEDATERSPGTLTLEEGLAHLASDAFAGTELDVDLKLPGYELQVLDALRAHGLLGRTLISSQYRSSLAVVRAAEPGVRLGWSVPKLTRDPFRSPALRLPVLAAMHAFRAVLPVQAARVVRAGDCDALMAHWRLVTPRLVRALQDAGGELYVWTVDELPRMRALDALGVTGVITNDPRLFAALA